MGKLYTILDDMDGAVQATGFTVEQAARMLLSADGHTWRIEREADGRFRLFYSQFSRNSVGWRGEDETSFVADTEQALFQKIADADEAWGGLIAVDAEEWAKNQGTEN